MVDQYRVETVAAVKRSLGAGHGAQPTPRALVDVFRRNTFPLLSLVSNPGLDLLSGSPPGAREQAHALLSDVVECTSNTALLAPLVSREFTAALAEDLTTYQESHREYARLVEAWSQVGVPCICFKSAGLAPSFPYTSGNIDILVPLNRGSEALRVLRALGYVELRNCEEPQKWLFRRFRAGRSVSAIHLHTKVGWGQGYMLEDALWSRAVRSDDDPWTNVPGREDATLINLAHAWVENKAFNLHDLYKIRHALSGDVDWSYLMGVAEERGWSAGLHFALLLLAHLEGQLYDRRTVPPDVRQQCEDAVRGNEWLARYWERLRTRAAHLPMAIPFVVSKTLHFQKLWCDRHLTIGEKPAETVLELVRGAQQKLRLRPQNAMLIALSGPDGSGKSAHARALAQAFTTAAIRNRVTWTRLGATPVLQALHPAWRAIAAGTASAQSAHGSNAHVFKRQGWRLAAWAAVASADYALWLLYLRWRLLRGEVVIADRFLRDFEVELAVRLDGWPRVLNTLRATVRQIAPAPRRTYLLRTSPEVAHRRLLGIGEAYVDDIPLTEQCRRYDALRSQPDLRSIDAHLPQDDVASSIVTDALTTYMNHYNPIGNTFLFAHSWQLNPTRSRRLDVTSRTGSVGACAGK